MERTNTGWRRLAPAAGIAAPVYHEAEKSELYAAGRLAMVAHDLKGAARFVLEHLIGCYGGEPVTGKLLVWPSNEFLMARTGLSERAVRYAIRILLDAGVIASHESANGKRYARRSAAGQIVAAYGFDLSPLLAGRDDHEAICEAKKERERDRRRLFDEITICRRAAQEALMALGEWFPEISTDDLEREWRRLEAMTPRRRSGATVDPALKAWQVLMVECESRYRSACGGKNCRQKETNNDAPDQSCDKGPGRIGAGDCGDSISLIGLAAACPDAFGYAGKIESEKDLVYEAGRLRGTLGAHRTAWEEACEALGPVAAGVALFLVLQKYEDDQTAKKAIKNPGGYFRSYIRLLQRGQITLQEEIGLMRRRRSH